MSAAATIRNRPLAELRAGERAEIRREIAAGDLRPFVTVAADVTGHGVDRALAADPVFRAALAQGGFAVAMLTTLVTTRLPGPGTRLKGFSLTFGEAPAAGDVALAEVTVAGLDEATGVVSLDARCRIEGGGTVAAGRIEAIAPAERIERPFGRAVAMEHTAPAPDRLEHIEELARAKGPLRMAVVHPTDAPSLRGALDSAAAGLIEPVLIGPAAEIRRAAEETGADLGEIEIVEADGPEAAARTAARLAAAGGVAALMKGLLHTDTLLRAVLDQPQLRGARRMSHVFVEDVPGHPRLLLVSDAAVNIRPDADDLRDIVQNAIGLAHALGIERPKVALLSAVETVTEDIPSTVAADAVRRMAERGEITGGDVDGPLAMDNAVSEQAARIKGIDSPVAGRADILIAPDLEAGNILAKDLDYLAGAEAAGIALGARVPIALTSRADTARERRASAALAVLMAATGSE